MSRINLLLAALVLIAALPVTVAAQEVEFESPAPGPVDVIVSAPPTTLVAKTASRPA